MTQILLVPHLAGRTEAAVWLAAIGSDPPRGLTLTLKPGDRPIRVPGGTWRRLSYSENVLIQTLKVDDLQPGRRYQLETPGGNAGRFSTLPDSLPREGERPFTVLLSSCFSRDRDEEGRFGRAVHLLPEDQKPDLKILCGDQVYLDLPIFEIRRADEKPLGEACLSKYLRSWTQKGTAGEGLLTVLETGSTCFTADDHEFWNNYPNWTTLIPLTWRREGREVWDKVAASLFRDFQSEDPSKAGLPRRIRIGDLSLFVADTRVFRGEGNDRFMRDEDIEELEQWVEDLEAPGVLVVGQPMFEEAAGWFGARFADRTLPNYEQYGRVVRALHRSPRSVMVLTGDVHYGRVSAVSFEGSGGPRLVMEVISSPASLVNPLVGGKAKDPPGRFPSMPMPGVVPAAARTFYKTAEDHFATLQFMQRAGRVRVKIHYWFPKRAGPGVLSSDSLRPFDL